MGKYEQQAINVLLKEGSKLIKEMQEEDQLHQEIEVLRKLLNEATRKVLYAEDMIHEYVETGMLDVDEACDYLGIDAVREVR